MMALTSSVAGTSSASGSSKRKNMFTSLFSKTSDARTTATIPGLGEAEDDCLRDERLESADLTAIWRSPSSKLDANEKALLEALHTAYLSRTEALRTYQSTVLTLTDQLTDLKTSNSALKAQLDITSQAHASLLSEITNPNGAHSLSPHALSDDGRLSPQSEGDDSGWWSDSGMGAEEDEDRMTMRSVSPGLGRDLMRRGSGAQWRRRASPETGEVKLLRKENLRLQEEVERLEGVLEDCSIVLGGMEAMRR